MAKCTVRNSIFYMAYFFGPDGQHTYVYHLCVLIFSIIGAVFSSANLVLIYQVNVYNGQIILIAAMTFSQFIYDATFYPSDVNSPYTVFHATACCQLFFGSAVALYSNVMASVVFYVIVKRKSFDILKCLYVVHACVFLVSFGITITYITAVFIEPHNSLHLFFYSTRAYYYLRLISIFYNFGIGFIGYYLVSKITKKTNITVQEEAIKTLAVRMLYYPLVQALGRSGAAWYEFQYGFNFDPDSVSRLQFVAQLYVAIITPAASVGYFYLFITMQPKAYEIFISWFGCRADTDNQEKVNDSDGVSEVTRASMDSGNVRSNGSALDVVQVANPLVSKIEMSKLSNSGLMSIHGPDGSGDHHEGRDSTGFGFGFHNNARNSSAFDLGDHERDSRFSEIRQSNFYQPERLTMNTYQYSRNQLNMKVISDEELMDLIDSN